jgi:hypothetical protein
MSVVGEEDRSGHGEREFIPLPLEGTSYREMTNSLIRLSRD